MRQVQNLRTSQTGVMETYYDLWRQDAEGVPSLDGLAVDDVYTTELHPWPRKGGKGVYINLSRQRISDAQIVEIAPGGSLNPEKHLFEELVFILEGRGATDIWNEGEPKLTFEWQKGSLFAIPLNCWHTFYNGSGTQPARYLAVTEAPLLMNRFRNADFVFGGCDFQFNERYTFREDYFSAEGKDYSDNIYQTNFVADVFQAPLQSSRGAGTHRARFFNLASGTMAPHIAVVSPGQYRFGHRHRPGAHILWIQGKGYDLTWETGTTGVARIDWRPGTMTSPPEWWYHQHFNTGKEPAISLAFHVSNRITAMSGDLRMFANPSTKELPFDYEDSQLREDFKRELAQEGIAFDMEETYRRDREARLQPA